MSIKTEHWIKALVAAFVTGAAGSLLSTLGISGAEMVGLKVAQLDLKQLAIMTIAGGIVGTAAYLKQSPVPPDDEEVTTTERK